jgi:hypothetical protein
MSYRGDVLREAAELIDGERMANYGPPEKNFDRIADMWTVLTDNQFIFEPHHVATFMAAVKLARLVESPDHQDSWKDLAGYAGLGAEVTL